MAGTLNLRRVLLAVIAAAAATLLWIAPAKAQSAGTLVGYNDDFNGFELHTSNPFDPILEPLPGLPLPLPELPLFGSKSYIAANGARLMDLARSGGADTIRYTVPWSRVERNEGAYDWSIEDETYELARERGLRPLIVLMTSPCWAHPSAPCPEGESPTWRPDPQYLDEFGEFVKATMKRYPHAAGFELWNESNLKRFWGPNPTPRSYAQMLAGVHEEIKDMGPHPPLLYNGLTPNKKSDKYLKRSLTKFGGLGKTDATAIHPYVGAGGLAEVRKKVRAMRKVLKAAKAPRPLWITEIGWSTHPDSEKGVTAAEQAKRIDGLLRAAPTMKIKSVLLHRLRDVEVSSPWESGLGVLEIDDRPKPIYCALGLLYGPQQKPQGCGPA